MTTSWDAWNYRESTGRGADSADIVGYHVHATDGRHRESRRGERRRRLKPDRRRTGPWIFGRKVILPAGVVGGVDDGEEAVYVDLTKDQIKDSPEWDQSRMVDDPGLPGSPRFLLRRLPVSIASRSRCPASPGPRLVLDSRQA